MNKVVFFDIDGVLIKKQTQKLFLNYLLRKNKISLMKAVLIYSWFMLYKLGFCKDVFRIRQFAFKVFRNWDKEIMNRLIKGLYHDVLSLNLNLKVINRLKKHQSQNDTVVFLSATLEEIANYLAKEFNVNYVIATKLEFIEGKYTGNISGEIPYGKNKVKLAQEFLEKNSLILKESLGYCDHYSDLLLLNHVNKAIVVDPEDKLKRIALTKNWEILIN